MFYGGALSAHIAVASTVQPASLRAAIRALGRHSAVVVDSDRPKPHARLKRDVKRFRDELDGDPHGHLCVTWGREVENHLPIEIINEIRREKKVRRLPNDDIRHGRVIDNALAKRMSKVAFAQRALQLLGDEV